MSFHSYRDGRARGSVMQPGNRLGCKTPKVTFCLPQPVLDRLSAAAAAQSVPLSRLLREICIAHDAAARDGDAA